MKAKLTASDSEARNVKSQLEEAKEEKEKLADEAKRRKDEANEVKAQLEHARSEQKKLANEIKQKEAEMADSLKNNCLLYTSPSPRDVEESRMPSSA